MSQEVDVDGKDVKDQAPPPGRLKNYSCSVCSKSYTLKNSLKRHSVCHSSNPRPYYCHLCGKKYSHSKSLFAHKRDVHEGTGKTQTFKCHLCTAVFSTESHCKRHANRFHNIPDLTQPSGSESGKRRRRRRGSLTHKCSICQSILSSQRKLEKHTCSGPRPPPETFQCPHCPRIFLEADLLLSHTAAHLKLLKEPETVEPSKEFECPSCKILFPGPLTLALHDCTNEYQHKCPHCLRRFHAIKFLNHHIRIHLNTRQHKSQYCNRTFHHQKDRIQHEKVHTERGMCLQRPRYNETCRICQASFLTPVLLYQHLLAKHNRPCSILVDRLLISPATVLSSSGAGSGGLALCNTCGDWFTEADYRLHRVLCDTSTTTSNEIEWMERAGVDDWIQGDGLGQGKGEPEPEEYSPPPSPIDFSPGAPENCWDCAVEVPACEDSGPFEDVKPGLGLLRANANLEKTICKLCGQVLPSSGFAEHFHEKHNQQLSVSVNRTLFKEMERGFHGILMVRPCEDTFHIPWFFCSRCGRTFVRKMFALKHKRNYCAMKPNQVEAQAQAHPQRKKLAAWKETWQVTVVPPQTYGYESIKSMEGGLFQCTICNRMYETVEKARLHVRSTHQEKFMCETCGLALSCKTAHEQHLRIHTGEKPFSCSTCQKRFRTRTTLVRHKRNVHPANNGPAEDVQQFKCMECQTLYDNYDALRAHIIETHPSHQLNLAQFPCYQCSKLFTLKDRLAKHLRVAHSVKPQYKCSECSKILNRPHTLRRHVLVFHPKAGASKMKWFGCRLCGKEVCIVSSIRKHLRKEHANVLPVQLLIENSVMSEDGNVVASMEDYFVRK